MTTHVATRPRVLGASTLKGDTVKNVAGEDLGKIEELMIDLETGRVGYCVLSFGGFLGIGNKLFAVPYGALRVDTEQKCFILNVPKDRLKEAPGFDKENWPDMTDRTWGMGIYGFYNVTPYWNS
jgi:sporulation protein YlmC with PRC-barrel domain